MEEKGYLLSPAQIMSLNIAQGWAWQQEMQRRREKAQADWHARRKALWFWKHEEEPDALEWAGPG